MSVEYVSEYDAIEWDEIKKIVHQEAAVPEWRLQAAGVAAHQPSGSSVRPAPCYRRGLFYRSTSVLKSGLNGVESHGHGCSPPTPQIARGWGRFDQFYHEQEIKNRKGEIRNACNLGT